MAASTWGGVGGLLPIIAMLMAELELGNLLYSVVCTTWNILKSINIFRDVLVLHKITSSVCLSGPYYRIIVDFQNTCLGIRHYLLH